MKWAGRWSKPRAHRAAILRGRFCEMKNETVARMSEAISGANLNFPDFASLIRATAVIEHAFAQPVGTSQ
jgi:hypothetical protein